MPHEPGLRSIGDKLVDLVKPFVERAVRTHGGRVILALPGLGDAMKYAIRQFGGKSVATAVLASGGLLKLQRSWFPEGAEGDKLWRLADETVDELAQAIAHAAEDASPEELEGKIDGIIQRLTGLGSGDVEGGSKTMAEDPDVYIWTQKDAGGAIIGREAHHPSCAELPPIVTTETAAPAGKGGKPQTKQKQNPDLKRVPRSHAVAQGVSEHAACMAIFAATAAKPSAKKGKLKPLELIGQLTDAERLTFWGWLHGLPPEDKAFVRHEVEERLSSVEELRAIINTPEADRLEAVRMLKDRLQEKAEAVRQDVQQGLARIEEGLLAQKWELRGTAARLRDRRRRLMGGG